MLQGVLGQASQLIFGVFVNIGPYLISHLVGRFRLRKVRPRDVQGLVLQELLHQDPAALLVLHMYLLLVVLCIIA